MVAQTCPRIRIECNPGFCVVLLAAGRSKADSHTRLSLTGLLAAGSGVPDALRLDQPLQRLSALRIARGRLCLGPFMASLPKKDLPEALSPASPRFTLSLVMSQSWRERRVTGPIFFQGRPARYSCFHDENDTYGRAEVGVLRCPGRPARNRCHHGVLPALRCRSRLCIQLGVDRGRYLLR